MEVPERLRAAVRNDRDVTMRDGEHDGRSFVALDFGPGTRVDVDVVGRTVIVVLGDDQIEFEVPRGTEVRANNGVLTVHGRS
jgi:hypothetical protein